jgi:hypothetical protein
MRKYAVCFSWIIVLPFISGCWLLNDATKFSIETEWQYFSIDSASLGLTVPSGTAVPAVPCNQVNDVCKTSGSGIACKGGGFTCEIACGSKGTCGIQANAIQSTSIDLSQQIKNNTQASALSKVSLQRVIYHVTENTLNFDTPQFDVLVGPAGSTSPGDTSVYLLGVVPAIPLGSMPKEAMVVTEIGKDSMSGFVKAYQTPFQLLVHETLSFASGDPIPQGRLAVQIKAYFEVEPMK